MLFPFIAAVAVRVNDLGISVDPEVLAITQDLLGPNCTDVLPLAADSVTAVEFWYWVIVNVVLVGIVRT
jgi:hypothetical protein